MSATEEAPEALTDDQNSELSRIFKGVREWLRKFFLIDPWLPPGYCPFCRGEHAVCNDLPQWQDIAHAEGYCTNPDCETREFEVYRWTNASGRKPYYQAVDRRLMRSVMFYVPPRGGGAAHPEAIAVGEQQEGGDKRPEEA